MPSLPDAQLLTVQQVAIVASAILAISYEAARSRIYRKIECGDIAAVRVLGSIRIPRAVAAKALEGSTDV